MTGLEINLQVYDNDDSLLDGLVRGDPDACTCVIKRYAPLIYTKALRIVGDVDEAENVLQQTFIKACAKLDTFEQRSNLGTWLYRIATNEALMTLRSRKSQVAIDDVAETINHEDIPHNLAPWSLDPSGATLDSELRRQIETALAELPASLRVVFVLREIEGRSTEETAEALDLSLSTVKVRLHRARLKLRELLSTYMHTEEAG
jgi:RNA polymerase sigma-70 factor (ECF subfamily)